MAIKSLFVEEPQINSSVLMLAVLSLFLFFVDHWTSWLELARAGLTTVVTPVIVAADFPGKTLEYLLVTASTRNDLIQEITRLDQTQILLRAQTQKMQALTAENNRLRILLGSAEKLQDNVVVAELIGIDPDPKTHEVIIDKGSVNGTFIGQSLLDAQGLMGQVISVSRYTSRVSLISDPSHSVPVQVARSNLRLVAQGSGATSHLNLMFVQNSADVLAGDLLITSGLGGRFPAGYPVAIVNKFESQSGKPFALVTAVPSALLNRSRYVLLVFTEDNQFSPPEKFYDKNLH